MSTADAAVAGAGLTPSPWPEGLGAGFTVAHNRAYVHPHPRFDRPGWCGFHVHHDTVYVNDAAAMAWPPMGEVRDLPEGGWVRIADDAGRLLMPFELRRRGARLEARWLDGDGAPAPPGQGAGDGTLDPLRYAPVQAAARWLDRGGWHPHPA